MLQLKFYLLLLLAQYVSTDLSTDFYAIQRILGFFGRDSGSTKAKSIAEMTPEELGRSRGSCSYNFVDFVSYYDRHNSAVDDHYIMHLLQASVNDAPRKPPIMVKCLQPDVPPNVTTPYDNSLLMITNVKEILALLKPIGNATKRHEPGSCVLVLFYTETSLGCAHVARYINMLPRFFPTLHIAAVDAFQFPSFNTEFGIVGLPTLLLFHQGRPIVKFYSDSGTFAAFITRHTGINPIETVPSAEEISGPLPLHPVQKPDYILLLAWGFILVCLINFFTKSRLFQQIVEMIKRNWRESEAQLENNT